MERSSMRRLRKIIRWLTDRHHYESPRMYWKFDDIYESILGHAMADFQREMMRKIIGGGAIAPDQFMGLSVIVNESVAPNTVFVVNPDYVWNELVFDDGPPSWSQCIVPW